MPSGSSSSSVQVRHLHAFAVLAQELHFTRAAQRLFIAQQTLSHQIAQLEHALGIILFNRSNRKVELTPAGVAFNTRVRPMLEEFDAALREARRTQDSQFETLAIAFTPTHAARASELKAAYLSTAPTARVVLVEGWNEQSVQGTESGQFDAALVTVANPPVGLASQEVPSTEIGIVLGDGDPLSRSQTVTKRQISHKTLVMWPKSFAPSMHEAMVANFKEHYQDGDVYEFETFTRGLFLEDERARSMILDGTGFAIASRNQVPPDAEGLTWVPLNPTTWLSCQLLFRPGARREPPLNGLLEVAQSLWAL